MCNERRIETDTFGTSINDSIPYIIFTSSIPISESCDRYRVKNGTYVTGVLIYTLNTKT